MARRGRLVAVAALCSLALTTAVVTVNGPHTAPNRTPLATGPGWRIDGASSIEGGSAGSAAATGGDQEWLAAGVVPGAGTRWASMVRFAMIDLHQLTRGNGAVAAGAAARWGYAWPRDMAFVAVAMARTGHRPDALRMLTFLQRVQAADGGFEARYRLDGRAPRTTGPDSPTAPAGPSGRWGRSCAPGRRPRGRPACARCVRCWTAARRTCSGAWTTAGGCRHRPPDYWEVPVARHQPAARSPPHWPGSGASFAPVRRARPRRPSGRPSPGPPRRGCDGELARVRHRRLPAVSAAVRRSGTRRSRSSCRRSPTRPDRASNGRGTSTSERPCARPAGWPPVRSGRRTARPGPRRRRWSPTPPAESGRPEVARRWLDWPQAHVTTWGSLPEKVLSDGSPSGPAPLAWSAAAVVLAVARLEADGPAAIS